MQGFALHSCGDLRIKDTRVRFTGCGDKILTIKSGIVRTMLFSLVVVVSVMQIRRLNQFNDSRFQWV
jgi:hypothetical protein